MPDGLQISLMQNVGMKYEDVESHMKSSHRGSHNCAWRWTLRLALPLLVFVSGLALYWIWFDHAFGVTRWDTIVVGLPLAIEAAAVSLWSVSVWCSTDFV